MLAAIRAFFAERGILEVETPLMMQAKAAEVHLHNLAVGELSLQTSPESAMKRLLAAGSGPIYQICKAFRGQEQGQKHNPEFTMLEWYRPGFSFEAMLQETLSVIELITGEKLVQRYSYKQLFEQHVGINPHSCDSNALMAAAEKHSLGSFSDMQHSDWLDLIMSQVIEPSFKPDVLTVVLDFPASQSALAKRVLNNDDETVARRFEVYFSGLELANGYDELIDAQAIEQQLQGNDKALLEAATAGIPASCGVALGLDRLLMASQGLDDIRQVLSFSAERA